MELARQTRVVRVTPATTDASDVAVYRLADRWKRFLWGLIASAVATFFFYAPLAEKLPDAARHITVVLWASMACLCFLVQWTLVMNRRTKRAHSKWTAGIFPLQSREHDQSNATELSFDRPAFMGKSDPTSIVTVVGASPGLSFDLTYNSELALAEARWLARFLELPLVDRTLGGATRYHVSGTSPTFRDRLQTVAAMASPIAPRFQLASVTSVPPDTLRIVLPPAGFTPVRTKVIALLGFFLVQSAFGLFITWAALYPLAIIATAIAVIVIYSKTSRTEIDLSPARLTVVKRSAIYHSIFEAPPDELTELFSSQSLPDEHRELIGCSSGIFIQAKHDCTTIAGALPFDEVKRLEAVLVTKISQALDKQLGEEEAPLAYDT
jgi:hypothetical protein